MQLPTDTPNAPKLPQTVAAYFAADQKSDVNGLALCFTDDAIVHDESHDYRGLPTILAWKQAAQAKYQYIAEPLEATLSEAADGASLVSVHAGLTGSFPGSPVEVTYRFTLTNDKITALAIL